MDTENTNVLPKYNTAQECKFIGTLGKHALDNNSLPRFQRRKLLASYILAMDKRRSWDGIDHKKVVSYAYAQFKEELLKDGN